MKRLHLHLSVEDLAGSVRFYEALFGAPPTVLKPDYAKWMLDDPRVNFAISARGAPRGLSHLGIQVDSARELDELRERMKAADAGALDQGDTTCCYARSTKSWAKDPDGIAWEGFLTTGASASYDGAPHGREAAGCCAA